MIALAYDYQKYKVFKRYSKRIKYNRHSSIGKKPVKIVY